MKAQRAGYEDPAAKSAAKQRLNLVYSQLSPICGHLVISNPSYLHQVAGLDKTNSLSKITLEVSSMVRIRPLFQL